jgi:hypothetical protein
MTLCKNCAKPLNVSQYNENRLFKSCPRCSTKNGEEHIFYKYPSFFGTTQHRESAKYPDGPQSHCHICRGGNDGPHPGYKKCSEF